MSAKVINSRRNSDLVLICDVEGSRTKVTITEEAIWDKFGIGDGTREATIHELKEKVEAEILVWLSNEEAHARLRPEYLFSLQDLNQIVGIK